MKAMVLRRLASLVDEPSPLFLEDMDMPSPAAGEILIRVNVCGVCHTELDEIEGRTPPPTLPVVPGHQVVGVIEETGADVQSFAVGDRVGAGWIYSACGSCEYCEAGNENLCPQFMATGRDRNGGYAEYMTIAENYACRLPEALDAVYAAPLMCAGAIGYRSLRLTGIGDHQRLGLTGFGASGHLVMKMAKYVYPSTSIYVFARGEETRKFALELGATWAGDIGEASPEPLHAIIDTTPAWNPVVQSLNQLAPGGRLVINAIRKEDTDKNVMAQIDYPTHLWLEKEIKSVANVARRDIVEFLSLAAEADIRPEVELFSLKEANSALVALKRGDARGAKVLDVG